MKKTIFTLGILLFAAQFSSAQLLLPDALKTPIEKAIAKNKEIANKQLELEKSTLERKSVLAKNIPTLDAVAGYAYFDNHVTMDLPGLKLPVTGAELFSGKTKADNRGNLAHAGLLAKTVLFSGAQIKNGAKALQQKEVGDSLLIETDKDKIIVDVITSFDKLKYVYASEKLIAESDKRLSKEEERVNKAIANGLAVPFDRDKIKLARLELESKRTQLEETKNLVYQKLVYLTGMSQQALEAAVYELNPIVLPENLTADNKQELEALSAYKKAGEWMLQKEKGTYLPQVLAFAGVSYSSLFNGNMAFNLPNLPPQIPQPNIKLNQLTVAPNWMAGVAFRWTIFGGNERRHKVHEAELGIHQLQNKLEDSKEKLNLLLSQKMVSYNSEVKQIGLANQQMVIARNNLTLADKQYQQGLISVTQRLEAENDFVKAGQNQTQALINQRQAALDAIAVTGKLSQKIQYQ